MPVLGAGASVGGLNRHATPIKLGKELAQLIAETAGFQYQDENLSEVFEAAQGVLSRLQINKILSDEYSQTTPSDALSRLVAVSWKRIYTFCVDDSIQFTPSGKMYQRRRYFNGIVDKVIEHEGPDYLHVIYLHGQAGSGNDNFIFSESEYAHAVRNNQLHWYTQSANDYLSNCPIFIGSKLQETVLWAQVERAKRDENTNTGLAFLITPETLTPIKLASLARRNVVHIKGTLQSFVQWLINHFPSGYPPVSVINHTTSLTGNLSNLSRDDLNAAHFLWPVIPSRFKESLSRQGTADLNRMGKMFMRGFPATWLLAASQIPVWLSGCDNLLTQLRRAIADRDNLFVVSGQAGSGKSTATMMILLRLASESNWKVYELNGEGPALGKIFGVLKKLGEPCIVYVDNITLYGDALLDELEKLKGEEIIVVTSSRMSEWDRHFSRTLGRFCKPAPFNRLSRVDYEPLINKLKQYLASPKFTKEKEEKQIQILARSKSQLLIALKEVTDSGYFGETITHEFENLPDERSKNLFLMVGIATIARVGISFEMAQEAYQLDSPSKNMKAVLEELSGIVEANADSRLFARHELYVRHILDTSIKFKDFLRAVTKILQTFVKYETPLIRKVNKRDGALFRFLLNNDFIFEVAKKHHALDKGVEVYDAFEPDFLLDGHFWLQYGLYLIRIKRLPEALDKLKKSVDAYPDNPFSQHALANLQFRLVLDSETLTGSSNILLQEAVQTLEALAGRGPTVLDSYPLVTLALGHVSVLAKHGHAKIARKLASEYHERLKTLAKDIQNKAIVQAQESMIRYVTLQEVPSLSFGH